MKILILGGVGVGAGVSGWKRRVEWQFNCRIVPGGWLILLIIVEKSESVQKQNSICDCTLFSITPFKMTSENFLWPVSKIAFFIISLHSLASALKLWVFYMQATAFTTALNIFCQNLFPIFFS